MTHGQYQKTIQTYIRGIEAVPQPTQLNIALGYAYLSSMEFDRSQKRFQIAMDHDPQNVDALVGIGRLNAIIGDTTDASNIYLLALSIHPKNETALSYLADLRMNQKDYTTAKNLFEQILINNPSAKWVKQALLKAQYGDKFDEIKALELSGNLNQAILTYQELLKVAPDSEDVYLGLGLLYTTTKRYREAIRLYQRGLARDSTLNQLRVNMGLTYLNMHQFKQAQRILKNALGNAPENADAMAGLGRIAALTGHPVPAQKFYQKALKIDPNNLLTLSYLGEFWLSQKQFVKAEKIYKKIANIDPQAIWAKEILEKSKDAPLIQKIKEKESNGEFPEAVALYLQLIAKAPNTPDYYVKLGKLYVKMNAYREAIALYHQGLKILPKSTDLQIALGFTYLDEGLLKKGKRVFENILKLDPNNAEAYAGLGRTAELSGNTIDAKLLYQNALTIDKDNITALVYMSDMLFSEGNYKSAEKLYKKIRHLEPAENWVNLAIEKAKYGRLIDSIKKKEDGKEYAQAEILWQQLLLEAPNVGDFYLGMGLFYHKIKQYEKAIDVYLKGIQIEPGSTDLYAALGLVYLSKKDLPSARKAFLKSLKFDPRNSDALAGLGDIAFLQDEFSKAEKLIDRALAIDPNRIAALSVMGDLLMKEHRYPEAQTIYEKLLSLRPNEKWIWLSLDDAKYGLTLDDIDQLISNDDFSEAARQYRYLLEQSPNNPHYYYGLGQMYMRLKEYGLSIKINLEGLEKNPDENELRVALGYAYFFNKNLIASRDVLTKAINIDSKNAEALAGLGRVNALEKDYCAAESLYQRALAVDQKNQSALSFYGDLLLKEKRYSEAQDIFATMWQLLPDAIWVQQGWKDARDGAIRDIATGYANQEKFDLAAGLYEQLVEASPEDPARYLPLGQMYVNMECYCTGISVYQQGLTLDPEAWYLWRAIAFAYIEMEDYTLSRYILTTLVDQNPDDAESWAGLGRIEALDGSLYLAEQYFGIALDIAPENQVALSFFADLRESELYNFTALGIYNYIIAAAIDPFEAAIAEPKWIRTGYHNALNLTQPVVSIAGAYHEEKQWAPDIDEWSAKYYVYGGKALINYPIYDQLTFWGSAADQFYLLKDLVAHTTIYSFDVQRIHLGAKWVFNPRFFVDARIGLSYYSPYRYGTFKMLKGTFYEPSLVFSYHTPNETASLSISTDSDLIARDFSTDKAKLVGYFFIAGTYAKKILTRGWIGFDCNSTWYHDFVNNNSQRAACWFQWRPPIYSNHILFRYFAKYQTFAKNIPDYYTYKPQVINQLQLTLEKSWHVCWADSLYTSLAYGHGWQDTKTRFRQIIVIAPTPTQTMGWDRRQFNIVIGNMIYKYDQLQLSLTADYYRDTEKYTMWTLGGDLKWRF